MRSPARSHLRRHEEAPFKHGEAHTREEFRVGAQSKGGSYAKPDPLPKTDRYAEAERNEEERRDEEKRQRE